MLFLGNPKEASLFVAKPATCLIERPNRHQVLTVVCRRYVPAPPTCSSVLSATVYPTYTYRLLGGVISSPCRA
jgi:hypothetical protein